MSDYKVLGIICLVVVSLLPIFYDAHRTNNLKEEFVIVERENRETIYGFNRVVNESRDSGKVTKDDRVSLSNYLDSMSEEDKRYIVSDDVFMDRFEKLLATEEHVVDGFDVESEVLSMMGRDEVMLSTEFPLDTERFNSTLYEVFIAGYYMFLFVVGLFISVVYLHSSSSNSRKMVSNTYDGSGYDNLGK